MFLIISWEAEDVVENFLGGRKCAFTSPVHMSGAYTLRVMGWIVWWVSHSFKLHVQLGHPQV